MGAFRIVDAEATTVFSPALDLLDVVAVKVTTVSPQQLTIISILPVVIGIRAGIFFVALVQSIHIQNISLFKFQKI